MQVVEFVPEWLGATAFAVVLVLLVWDPVQRTIAEWRLKRAFRRWDKMDT